MYRLDVRFLAVPEILYPPLNATYEALLTTYYSLLTTH